MTAIAVWLVSWGGLHSAWQKKSMNLGSSITIALILISIGFAATFPPFFQLAERQGPRNCLPADWAWPSVMSGERQHAEKLIRLAVPCVAGITF